MSHEISSALCLKSVSFLQSRRNPTLEPHPPTHERAALLEPVTSRDRCVRGRFLGRTESSLTFGRHRPPRENHSAGMGYGTRWCRQPESLRGSIAARTNENARLRQQLEAAATVVATLHYRRENIGRNGRSRRLVTPGRQDAAFVMVGSVGNISPRVPAGWGAGVEDQAGQVHDSWRAGPA